MHNRASTRLIGRALVRLDRVTSTNDVLRAMIPQAAEAGTAAVAAEQTAGRGRLGRPWASPRGGLWLSVLLQEEDPGTVPLAQVLAVGATEGVRAATGLDVRLEWPNDLVVGDPYALRKVGGILVEAVPPWAIAGIGVNVNVDPGDLHDALRAHATSLAAAASQTFDLEAVLDAVLDGLDAVYAARRAGRVGEVLQRWRRLSVTLGRRVEVVMTTQAFEGLAEDIADDGALVVATTAGRRRVVAADVRLLAEGTS